MFYNLNWLGKDTQKSLRVKISYSLAGEGKGNPLQYSGLENSMVRAVWGFAVYEFVQVRYNWVTNTHSLTTKSGHRWVFTATWNMKIKLLAVFGVASSPQPSTFLA